MTTVIHRHAKALYGNKASERDVTVKLTDGDGTVRYCNGFITEIGSAVYGCSLDPDADYELEYARPDIKLTLINYSGAVRAIEAWMNTPNGPRTVFRQSYQESTVVTSSDQLEIVGPAY